MKILHVETGMNLYGGALQVHYLLRGLADHAGVENTLVCPEGSAIAETARENVKLLHTVPMRGDLDILFIPRLFKFIREVKPNIIHLHSRRGADILGGIAARISGTPSILTRRVDNPENRLWTRIKYRFYNRIITISDGIREVLVNEGVPHNKITCVRSAVDISQYQKPCDRSLFTSAFGVAESTITCGVVAQFIDRKGHRYLLEAIPAILSAFPDTHFLLFGKGPLEKELRDICRRLGIAEKVTFTGFREDLDNILGCLDILIHPALMEGLGVSLLQAAAAGVPIVGTRVGGIPEIVLDGVNGLLIPPSDASSITDAVKKIIGNRDLAGQMADAGRKITKDHFSIEAMVEGNLQVYREIMKGKSRVQGPESREGEES